MESGTRTILYKMRPELCGTLAAIRTIQVWRQAEVRAVLSSDLFNLKLVFDIGNPAGVFYDFLYG